MNQTHEKRKTVNGGGVGVGSGDYKAQSSQAEQVRPVCQTKREAEFVLR